MRARGAPDGVLSDASERCAGTAPVTAQPPGADEALAALERRLTAALGEGAAQTLRRAEEAFVAVLGPPAAGRLSSLPTIRRLLWALARLDRYGHFGRGGAGAGLGFLEGLLEGEAHAVRWEGAAPPRHLAYFLPALLAEGRKWKHRHAPRIKAARRARYAARRTS